jgi:hypothetical protein
MSMQKPIAHLEQLTIPSTNISPKVNGKLFDKARPRTTSQLTAHVMIKIVLLPIRSLILSTNKEANVHPKKIMAPISPI